MKNSLECPLIPMGALTGKPDKAFLTETLEAYRSVGVTQFLLYPRSGCELDYLSEEWFAVCEHILKEAERLGFTSIWLYDEFNWPSGTCGGRVLQDNPEYALQFIAANPDNGFQPLVRQNPQMSSLLNPDAVAKFIRLTHDAYAARFQEYFGRIIKGVFSDEPGIAYFTRGVPADAFRMPYYPGMEDDYKKMTGGELFADIQRGLQVSNEFFRIPCQKLLAERFRSCFVEPVSSWCQKHGLLLTGHLMDEYEPLRALYASGHPLRALSAFTLPGMDEIFTRSSISDIEWITFGTLMYAAEKQGNKGALAELFALGPADLTPTKIVRQIWLAASFGINHYVMAVSALDHRGNIPKPAYFHPFTRTQPWFDAYPELAKEATEASSTATLERECRVAVRYPYTPVPITSLLKRLTSLQYSWKLVLPEEETDADVILTFVPVGIQEEKSGAIAFDFDCLEHEILQKQNLRTAKVENPDGSLADDLFIRCFIDGSVTVIDFSGRDRNLVLDRKGVKSNFLLRAEGVTRFPGWQVALDRPNTMRCFFTETKCTFNLLEDIPDLRICVRHCGPQVKLLLDGKPVETTEPCTDLPQGFIELYRQTTPLALTPGAHEITWLNPEPYPYPYFPEAILTGAFAATPDHSLSRYKDDGAGLFGYAGKISQKATLKIPVDALKISFPVENLAAELFLDGQPLGQRLHAPYTWLLPQGVQGKEATITLVRMTSCAPIFGTEVFTRPGIWHPGFQPNVQNVPAPFCEIIWE